MPAHPDDPALAHRDAFWRDGVVCVRAAVPQRWIDPTRDAVDRVIASLSDVGRRLSHPENGFFNDVFSWRRDAAFESLMLDSPIGHVAGRVMDCARVTLFHDQLFVKEPRCPTTTPWHQDLPYWPVAGHRLCSVWMPLDPVTERTGTLEFVPGSHRWGPFKARSVRAHGDASTLDPEVPDIEANRALYRPISFDLEPGDLLVFHPMVLHGSSGNASATSRRRAIATRWLGDGVVYAPRPNTVPLPEGHGLDPGGSVAGPMFPHLVVEPS